jgi:hypothetical protein
MSAFKKHLTIALTALTLGTAALASASSAEAKPFYRNHGWGVGAAIIGGLAVAGAYAATRPVYGAPVYAQPVYDDGYAPRRCHLVDRVNHYGEVVTRRVCRSYY